MHAQRFNSIVNFSTPDAALGIHIASPATGKIAQVEQSDPNALGQGIKLQLEGQSIHAPVSGTVISLCHSHAKVIIQTRNRLKFLLTLPQAYSAHHGLGVKALVCEGQMVSKGQPLFMLDLYKIQMHMRPAWLYVSLLTWDAITRIDVPLKHVEIDRDTLFTLVGLRQTATNKLTKK